MSTVGLDLYAGNGAVDLAKAKAEDGVQFTIFKATEGATFEDARFADNWDHAVAVNVQPGAYHFARPDNNSATTEAQHFLKVLGNRRGIVALDGEKQPNGWPLSQLALWYSTWLDVVAQATGLRPFLYTYHRWIVTPQFDALRAKWPLWIPLDPETPAEIVQQVKVVGTLGNLDVDLYGGTLDDLRREAGLAPASAQKGYSMLVFAQGLDATTALAVCAARRLGVATTDVAEAKAAIARGDKVVVIGGPAAAALGLKANPGQPTPVGGATVAIGQTAADTLTLACQVIA